MKLTERQLQMLKHASLVDLSHKARKKSAMLLNDQGFTVLSISVSKEADSPSATPPMNRM